MIHAREDYNRFQDPAIDDPSLLGEGCTAIGADEPVMLFRAKDKHFVKMLNAYRLALLEEWHNRHPDERTPDRPSFERMVKAIDAQIALGTKWQRENGCKVPDMP